MIRTATRADLPRIRELIARSNDAPYDLQPVAEEKLFGRGINGEPSLRVFEEAGELLGFAVECGRYLRLIAVDRKHRRRGIGTRLLGEGATVIAAEPGNYFTPGVHDRDDGTIAFLQSRGFREMRSTWNLTVNLAGSGVAPPTRGGALERRETEGRRRGSPALHNSSLAPRRVAADDQSAFLDFVEREFGRIWRFEAARAFENDPPTALWIPDIGFVVHEANNRGLGTFGPTGVAKRHRGGGFGRRLLLASLAELQSMGFDEVTIPWTDAIDFYRKSCGAEPAHRFITFEKSL